jgi:hypothetical protein
MHMLFSEQNYRNITMGNSHQQNRNQDRDRDRAQDRHRDRDRNRSAMETHPNQDNGEEKIPLITLGAGLLIILEWWGKNR